MKNTTTSTMTKSPQVSTHKSVETSSDASFEKLYLKKDYKGAVNYLLQNKQRFDSGIFHYNLGTVYSKIGDQPTARFHLEKAIKEGHINSSSLNNLTYVRNQLQVDDLSTSSNFPDQFMNYSLAIPPAVYLSISLLFLLLGISLIKSKKLIKKTSIAIFILLIVLPVSFSNLYLDKINYAVAFKDVPLYEGPSKIFSEKGKVKAGSKIILGEFKEGWFYVKFPISLTGWINKDQLGIY
ncbi:MAG: SH3 domain-containing protein [Alphaproteobacteria bacterium]|nr:MAG: SH3 domain-containing protein [Alphaproteobacteria bacterium]